MEREQAVVGAKLSVAAGLKRARPMRGEFMWIGGLLRAGERRDCSRQALEAEGFELLRGALFLLHNAPTSRRKRAPRPKPMYSTLYFHSFSSDGHLHFTTSSSSLSTLSILTYIYILTKACR